MDISLFSLVITVLALIIALLTFCLQCKGNKIANKVRKQAEKISTHQDRIEFFQKKNYVIEQVKSLDISKENSTRLIKDIEFIFENKFAHIVVKDTEGSFPKLSMDRYENADEIDNWINELQKKIIKIHLIKEGKGSYALPAVSEDFERHIGVQVGQIKGLKEENYYWKNNQIKYIPGFLFHIEEIGHGNRESIELNNEHDERNELKCRFGKIATLNKEGIYSLDVSKVGENFRWIIYDSPNYECVRVEVKFVDPDRLECTADGLKSFIQMNKKN